MSRQSIEIISIGAGGIVKDAHLPAYKIAGFKVVGIYDIYLPKAELLARKFGIPKVYETLHQAIEGSSETTIFDLAIPGKNILEVLQLLPDNSFVLIQKPMGETLEMAKKILDCCRRKKIIAAINFQLRYAPFITRAKELIKDGKIGEICDIEIIINVYTPWHLWDFLKAANRVEILYHSIHYVDLVRSFMGNPQRVYAKSIKHPNNRDLASVRSAIILDYGPYARANILTSHSCDFDPSHQCSTIKIEGTKGAIRIEIGLLKNYPKGTEDQFEYVIYNNQNGWQKENIQGTWFPHAFIGSMKELEKAKSNSRYLMDNSVEDCIHTMAVVEAAYISNKEGGIAPDIL